MAETGNGRGIPEGGFEDIEQFRPRLDSQPREVAMVFAFRNVARLVPLVAREDIYFVLLQVLRALSIVRYAALWPGEVDSKILESAKKAFSWAATHDGQSGLGADVSYAAALASEAVFYDHDLSSVAGAIEIGHQAASYSVAEGDTFLRMLNWDLYLLEKYGLENLRTFPVWGFEEQEWVYPDYPSGGFGELSNVLLGRLSKMQSADHWDVSIDWLGLEGKGLGGKPDQVVERARILGLPEHGIEITDDYWKAGPAVVNSKIRQVLDRFKGQAAGTVAERPLDAKTREVVVPPIPTKRLPAIRLSIESLKAQVARDLDDHIAAKPNDEEKLVDWQAEFDLLEQIGSKLDQIAKTIDGSDLTEPRAKALERVLAELAQGFENWFVENTPEVVDWAIRLPTSAGMIGLMNLVGANMFVSTTAVLAYVGGDKMVRLYKQMVGKAEKRDD